MEPMVVIRGRIGDEASMIAHAAQYGVVWEAGVRYPEPPDGEDVWWSERVWPLWTMVSRSSSQRATPVSQW